MRDKLPRSEDIYQIRTRITMNFRLSNLLASLFHSFISAYQAMEFGDAV